MSALAPARRERLRPPGSAAAALWPVVLTGLFVAVGVAVALQPALAGLVPLALVWALVVRDWRAGLLGLVCFLPFAGLPLFVLQTKWALLLKDVLLVAPLYLSFAVWFVRRGRRLWPRGDRLAPLLVAFAGLALVYLLASPSLLVGLIGLKVWLFYLPLYLLGYHYVERAEDALRLVRWTVVLGLAPALLALAELVSFTSGGGFGPFMHLYGRFQGAVAQEVGFAQVIPRVPSTFSSAAGYYNFSLVALAAAFALWRYRRSRLAGALVLVFAAAALASGIRRSYLTVPLLVAAALLAGRAGRSTRLRVLLGAAVLLLVLAFAGVRVSAISGRLFPETAAVAGHSFHAEFLPALAGGLVGQGTGSDTNAAARYGGYTPPAGWREGWYTKALLEFGIPGLFVVLGLVVAVLRQGARQLRLLDRRTLALAAPLWAVLLVTALTSAKASELDWDPMNAYFWLFAGLLAGLARLAQTGEAAR